MNAVESDSVSEVAFSMTYNSDFSESDILGDMDWFDEVVMIDSVESDWFSEDKVVEPSFSVSDNNSLEDLPLLDALDVALAAAEVANLGNHCDTLTRAELYDSGCTKNISPYQDDLTDFSDIPPKIFRAANKQSFSATGIGNLIVDLPNHIGMSKLELTDSDVLGWAWAKSPGLGWAYKNCQPRAWAEAWARGMIRYHRYKHFFLSFSFSFSFFLSSYFIF